MTATEKQPDLLPPLKPAERFAQLEVDAFCVDCGYNLHSQPVTRDERLGIFIARCPECGKFHPAGVGITAAGSWSQRSTTALLVLWVLFLMFAIFWIMMAMGTVVATHAELLSYRKPVAPDGRPAHWKGLSDGAVIAVYDDNGQAVNNWREKRTTQVQTLGPWQWNERRWILRTRLTLLALAAGVGLFTGMLLAIFLWHWPKKRYLWVILLPLAAGLGSVVIYSLDPDYDEVVGWMTMLALGYAAFEGVFLVIGVKLGRPLARLLLSMFIPPRPRQHFAFLWRVDGKATPLVPR